MSVPAPACTEVVSVWMVNTSLLAVPLIILKLAGVSLTLLMVSTKVSLTLAFDVSVAVTVILIEPTLLFVGVPLRTPVVVLILNQLGKAEPLGKVAE